MTNNGRKLLPLSAVSHTAPLPTVCLQKIFQKCVMCQSRFNAAISIHTNTHIIPNCQHAANTGVKVWQQKFPQKICIAKQWKSQPQDKNVMKWFNTHINHPLFQSKFSSLAYVDHEVVPIPFAISSRSFTVYLWCHHVLDAWCERSESTTSFIGSSISKWGLLLALHSPAKRYILCTDSGCVQALVPCVHRMGVGVDMLVGQRQSWWIPGWAQLPFAQSCVARRWYTTKVAEWILSGS